MGRAVCVDQLNPMGKPGRPTLNSLYRNLGTRHVARNNQSLDYWAEIYVPDSTYLVLTQESFPTDDYAGHAALYASRYKDHPPTIWLLGNEPNISGPACWTLDPDEYNAFYAASCAGIKGILPDAQCYIGGIFAQGLHESYDWLDAVLSTTTPDGLDLHYPDGTSDLDTAASYNLPLSITEWCYSGPRVSAQDVRQWLSVLERYTPHTSWFGWSDSMGDGQGLVSVDNHCLNAYYNLKWAMSHLKVRQ